MGERINMPFGYIEVSGLNDLKIISTTGDPVNAKFASPEGVALGAMSWGILRDDGDIETKVLFQGKVDETTRFNSNIKERGGEFTIHIHDGKIHYDVHESKRDDASFQLVLMARHNVVWVRDLVTAADYPNGLPGWTGPLPSTPQVPKAPPTTEDRYKGFLAGDFASLEAYCGFESEDRLNYINKKMTWTQVVDAMLKRKVPTDPTANQ